MLSTSNILYLLHTNILHTSIYHSISIVIVKPDTEVGRAARGRRDGRSRLVGGAVVYQTSTAQQRGGTQRSNGSMGPMVQWSNDPLVNGRWSEAQTGRKPGQLLSCGTVESPGRGERETSLGLTVFPTSSAGTLVLDTFSLRLSHLLFPGSTARSGIGAGQGWGEASAWSSIGEGSGLWLGLVVLDYAGFVGNECECIYIMFIYCSVKGGYCYVHLRTHTQSTGYEISAYFCHVHMHVCTLRTGNEKEGFGRSGRRS